jgi:membrane protein YqaA with SNARE-associated domain
MKRKINSPSAPLTGDCQKHSKARTFLFILQIVFVLSLLALWLSSESIRASKSLWILFFYSFPAEFLLSTVPHEPVILYFGKFFPPLKVALVAGAGTLLAEALNYSIFHYISFFNRVRKVRHTKFVKKIVDLFNRAPFPALLVAAFTPVPFYPFRFLVVLAHYPLAKYLLAILLSRTPRFFLIALIGYTFKIPDYLLLALFAGLILAALVPYAANFLKKKRRKKSDAA